MQAHSNNFKYPMAFSSMLTKYGIQVDEPIRISLNRGKAILHNEGQLSQYLYIYKSQCCTEHWQVNKYIERKNMWDDFSELRSVNMHGNGYSAKGILPKYFSIICEALNIEGDGGSRLLSADSY